MPKVKSEYEVEELYIDRLSELGYEYVDLKNYDDVCSNFREQFCKLNSNLNSPLFTLGDEVGRFLF